MIDKLLKRKGYILKEQNAITTRYEKEYKKYGFVQVLAILHKESGNHIIQSYDKKTVRIGNRYLSETCGIETSILLLLFLKVKYLSFKYKW
jgi:hypothetical protein|uniref:Uncharacterized protein n=1 Tax=virus sp. ctyMK1 TaxID=2828002 RepID=A0A8S5RFA2_9VIRU|nr:MAG TPA: hypothetical protein [virus sp. ctyMK1]